MKQLQELVRKNIWELPTYAKNKQTIHSADIFLNANENPYNKPYNRYPDPYQTELKAELAKIKSVRSEQIFLSNGADEAIDLCYRVFCEPQKDNVVAIEPTYCMYKVCAAINNVEYRSVMLNEHFQLSADKLLAACDEHTKLIWVCSPNNPTGNNLLKEEIEKLITSFNGIIIIDEAYSDFSKQAAFRKRLADFPNIIVLNTLSNSWGCAGIRLGMVFAQEEIINQFNKVKLPHNINILTLKQGIEALTHRFDVEDWLRILLLERTRMIKSFAELPFCEEVYPTDANFFLAKVTNAQAINDFLLPKGIKVCIDTQCKNCLRITIGAKSENTELIGALRQFKG